MDKVDEVGRDILAAYRKRSLNAADPHAGSFAVAYATLLLAKATTDAAALQAALHENATLRAAHSHGAASASPAGDG